MSNEKSGESDYAGRERLVELVKRDVRNIACIYPTAFDLYGEPLDRLARRVVRTFEQNNVEGEGRHMSDANGACPSPPDWVAEEIKATWRAARDAGGQIQAFRIIERMVDRLGYGRTEDNPSLVPNAGGVH